MCRAIVLALALAILGGCGPSSKSSQASNQPPQARQLIDDACVKFAKTVLSTDPTSGIPQMSISVAAETISQAANSARSAAALDPAWTDAAHSLRTLAEALSTKSNAKMRTALPATRQACDPVIAALANTPTSR